ncbi:hypothetical protein MBLNU459_g4312t1 [Dothideomycetes sp. NU459]
MPTNDPKPVTWTLRFKNHKTTVVLYAEKTQNFASLKTELLNALRATNPDGMLHDTAIPTSADDVLLARPIDHNNLDLGWESIEPDALTTDADLFGDDEAAAKGKGKAKAKSGGYKDCPLGSGLRDGGAVAFKFRGVEGAKGANDGDIDEGLGLDDDDANKAEWDVILPTYEDVYGLEGLVPDDQLGTPKADRHSDWS